MRGVETMAELAADLLPTGPQAAPRAYVVC